MSRARHGSTVASRYVPVEGGPALHRVRLEGASDEELATISQEMSIGLSVDEMKRVRDYFAGVGRDPTDVELEALGQAWSEHCCYKSSKPVLRRWVYGVAEHKIAAREDAGLVEFDDDHYYAAKMESHNHPSAIEPYGGAATGIGGVLRDVVCMGAQPIALVDPLFFGPLDMPQADVPKGSKHPRYLFQGVVEGIRDYGNRVGIPTVAGMVRFHPGYTTNPLVNVGCVGIMPKKHYTPSRVKSVGDVYIYAGGATGRDGIHGVTFASAELHEESEEASRSAVQLGDPITKEPLIHACLEIIEKGLAPGMKDFGGGGLSCVCSEMALDAGLGCEIDLEKVPLKEADMAPWEIWVSESQERMMVAVSPDDVDEVLHIFKKWDVTAVAMGRAIKEPVTRVRYKGTTVLEMDLKFQTGGPEYDRPIADEHPPDESEAMFDRPSDPSNLLLKLLGDFDIASKEWVIRQYDHEVRASTVLKPLQGRVGFASPGDAAVLKPLEGSFKGLALTTDVNPRFMAHDAYWGAASAMDEAVRNLASVGARVSSVCDNLNFGNPEDPEVMLQLERATRGLALVAKGMDVPFSSGNVSLYNEGTEGPVPPTPSLMAVGIVEDLRRCTTTDLKAEGNRLYLVGPATRRELGGSAYLHALGIAHGERVPRVDVDLTARTAEAVVSATEKRLCRSVHDVAEGGIAVAVCEMGFGGDLAVTVDLDAIGSDLRSDIILFSETNTRYLIEVAPKDTAAFEAHMHEHDTRAVACGIVGGDRFVFKAAGETVLELGLAQARRAWDRPLHEVVAG